MELPAAVLHPPLLTNRSARRHDAMRRMSTLTSADS